MRRKKVTQDTVDEINKKKSYKGKQICLLLFDDQRGAKLSKLSTHR